MMRERREAAAAAAEEEEAEEAAEDEEDDDDEGEEEEGARGALGKSAEELRTEDVYDISYALGRELQALGGDPARRARLQFQLVRVLELLEALVSGGSRAAEQLRLERDSLRRELGALRGQPARHQLSLGPDKMVIDLTDPNRPRFTLRELEDVLQERNQLKAQLHVVQEELQCYKRVHKESKKEVLENIPSISVRK
ncbi:RILP-like protein 2 [Alligator mississippiensis]|uniref:RILP-like protein 2 n=1 Tax=Alligator mississippiensis TaxID=8496 RepID=A0A151NT33_ALLMI|nr:RILP-like protein 2 [Alligator mississippiensis]